MQISERRKSQKFHIDAKLRRGFKLEDLVILPSEGKVIGQGYQRHLPPKAIEILLYLCQNRNRLMSIENLLVFGWGDANAKRANLTHVISEIRQALDDHKECPEFIQTIPRKGYRLIAKVTPLDEKVLYPSVWPLDVSPKSNSLSQVNPDNHWHLSLALFKNSKLFSVSIAFIVSTWVLIQVFEVLFPIFNVPDWGMKIVVLVLVVGFPLALIYTWLKEVKTKRQLLARKQKKPKSQFFIKQLAVDFSFIGLMSIGVAYLAFYLVESIEEEQKQTQTYRPSGGISLPLQDDLIAVLPFNFHDEGEIPLHFKGTVQGELIFALATQKDYKLVSQRAINELPARSTLDDYAAKLGARYLLEGTLIGKQNAFTVMLNITDTINSVQVWSSSLEGKAEDLLNLQKEIYRRVFNALALLAKHQPDDNYAIISTKDFKAYDNYIQAKSLFSDATEKEELEKAEQLFLTSLASDPKFSLAIAGLCQTYLKQYEQQSTLDSFNEAKAQCGTLLTIGQLKAEGYIALADLNRISGKHIEALAIYEQALALRADDLEAISGLAMSNQELKRYDKAENLFRKIVSLEPGYWRNYSDLGNFFFSMGNYKAAAEQYQRVVLMRPEQAQALNTLGAAYYLDMQFEKASEAWGHSLELNPSAENYSNLGTSLFFSQLFKKAAQSYAHAVELSPQNPVIRANLGDAQKFSGELENSKAAYKIALELTERKLQINPVDAVMLGLRSKLYAELENCILAIEAVDKLAPLNISDPYLYYDLSIASLRCGQQEKSIRLLSNSVQLGYPIKLLQKDIQFSSIIKRFMQYQGDKL